MNFRTSLLIPVAIALCFLSCTQNELRNTVNKAEILHYIYGLERFSVDTFHSDSSIYFVNKVDSILHTYEEIDSFKWTAYPLLINVYLMVREHKKAEVLSGELLDFQNYQFANTNNQKSIAYSLHAHLISLDGKIALSKELLRNANSLSDQKINGKSYQLFLKNWMLIAARNNNEEDFQEFHQGILNVIDNADTLHQNLYRVVGEYYATKPDGTEETIYWFEKAKEHLKLQFDYALRSTINYFLSDAYTKIQNFDHVLQIYFEDLYPGHTLDKEVLLTYKKEQVPYGYITLVQIAYTYVLRYVKEGRSDDLAMARNIIVKCDSIMNHQDYILNENRDINMLHHSDRLLDVALLIFYEEFKKSGNPKFIDQILSTLHKNRSYIFKKELMLQDILDAKLYYEYITLKREISSSILPDVIDNKQNRKSLERLKVLEDSLSEIIYEKYTPQYITSPLILFENVENILKKLNASLVIFNQINDEQLLRVLIEKGQFHLDLMHIDKNKRETIDSLISFSQDPFAELSPNFFHKIGEIFPGTDADSILMMNDGVLVHINFTRILKVKKPHKEVMHLIDFDSLEKLRSNSAVKMRRMAAFAFSDSETIRKKHTYSSLEIPFTIKEAKQLAEEYPGKVDIFSGRDATIENFNAVCSDSTYSHIHLALHGYSSGETREDIKLFFRNQDFSLDTFYGYQIPYMKNKKKIVLSACDTNKGVYTEGEGIYSLSNYFLRRGVDFIESNNNKVVDKRNNFPKTTVF